MMDIPKPRPSGRYPRWAIRKSSLTDSLTNVYRWNDDFHGVGGYAAVESFASYEDAAKFIAELDNHAWWPVETRAAVSR